MFLPVGLLTLHATVRVHFAADTDEGSTGFAVVVLAAEVMFGILCVFHAVLFKEILLSCKSHEPRRRLEWTISIFLEVLIEFIIMDI